MWTGGAGVGVLFFRDSVNIEPLKNPMLLSRYFQTREKQLDPHPKPRHHYIITPIFLGLLRGRVVWWLRDVTGTICSGLTSSNQRRLVGPSSVSSEWLSTPARGGVVLPPRPHRPQFRASAWKDTRLPSKGSGKLPAAAGRVPAGIKPGAHEYQCRLRGHPRQAHRMGAPAGLRQRMPWSAVGKALAIRARQGIGGSPQPAAAHTKPPQNKPRNHVRLLSTDARPISRTNRG